jgi:hypothetical protein
MRSLRDGSGEPRSRVAQRPRKVHPGCQEGPGNAPAGVIRNLPAIDQPVGRRMRRAPPSPGPLAPPRPTDSDRPAATPPGPARRPDDSLRCRQKIEQGEGNSSRLDDSARANGKPRLGHRCHCSCCGYPRKSTEAFIAVAIFACHGPIRAYNCNSGTFRPPRC